MFEAATFGVHRCAAGFVRATVERDHYKGKWPHPKSIPFAYCLSVDGRRSASDGKPFGLLVFKQLQHQRQRGLFGYEGLPTKWQVLDMARVWVHPDLQNVRWEGLSRPYPTGARDAHDNRITERRPAAHTLNVFSRMVTAVLGKTHGMDSCPLQRDWLEHHPPVYPELPYHIRLVISYCELEHHDGTGYRASGFERWGMTADGTKEIYLRRLKAPRTIWRAAQASLFAA